MGEKSDTIMSNWKEIIQKLETGEIRAAERNNGSWEANREVKEGILSAFRDGKPKEFGDHHFHGFVDKHNLPPRQFQPENRIRMVPGGSSVRCGTYVAPGVIIIPPSYINIGAYVDEGTMIDSHALVGSCAQIGKSVHLSAGVQIGGVLEPVGLTPVIVEDNAFIGAGAVIVEGVQIGEGAVIAPGVALSKSVPVYDCVREKLIKDAIIPPGAVVISGTRPVAEKRKWAHDHQLQMQCALIVKYRDEKTDASLELEDYLR